MNVQMTDHRKVGVGKQGDGRRETQATSHALVP